MKKRTLTFVLSLGFMILAFNSFCQQPQSYANKITADSLSRLLKGKHGVLLDVRTPGEYKKGHIPGAINIDFLNDSFPLALDTLDKNIQYEVYCHSGGRSGEATELMKQNGFKRILDLEGGFSQWQAKNLPVVK